LTDRVITFRYGWAGAFASLFGLEGHFTAKVHRSIWIKDIRSVRLFLGWLSYSLEI
jgi:hypothetical protein